jgi:hypothetical protein
LVPPPSVDGHPYNPGDGSTDFVIRVYGDVGVRIEGDRGDKDGMGAAYLALDSTFGVVCMVEQAVCDALAAD